MRPSRVWYLAYGSNVDAARFRLYLESGATEPGARDPSPPRRDVWVRAPQRLSFAGESQRWSGGGVAFVTPTDSDTRWAWLRAWDITAEQFEDVFAQENRARVGTALPWHRLADEQTIDVGSRWYRRILRLDVPELAAVTPDQPALTFTWTEPMEANPPHPDYRATIARGLATNPSLDEYAIEAYLDAATIDP